MITDEMVRKMTQDICELQEDVELLLKNIEQAREYLNKTKPENINEEFFDSGLDICKGLKHIELF